MPTQPKLPDTFVVLGMHAENQLDVFVRSEDNELHQAARIATHNGVNPASMSMVLADLADTFGWRQIATAPTEVPQPEPAARVLQAPTREVRSAAADRTSTPSLPRGLSHSASTAAIYERIMKALDDVYPSGLRFGELHSIVGRGRSSGQVFGYMAVLVRRKLVVRPSEGLYVAARQGALPVEPVTDSRLAAKHPAGTAKRKGGAKPGSNTVHALSVEQVVEHVAQHPEGVRVPQIADALLPNDKESRHTVSNRMIAYFTRAARTGEPLLIHKVVAKDERNKVTATYLPGPPPS